MTILRIPTDRWSALPAAKHHIPAGVRIGEPNTDTEPGFVLIEDPALTPGDQVVFDALARDDGANLGDLPVVDKTDDGIHEDQVLAEWRLGVLAAYPEAIASKPRPR